MLKPQLEPQLAVFDFYAKTNDLAADATFDSVGGLSTPPSAPGCSSEFVFISWSDRSVSVSLVITPEAQCALSPPAAIQFNLAGAGHSVVKASRERASCILRSVFAVLPDVLLALYLFHAVQCPLVPRGAAA